MVLSLLFFFSSYRFLLFSVQIIIYYDQSSLIVAYAAGALCFLKRKISDKHLGGNFVKTFAVEF